MNSGSIQLVVSELWNLRFRCVFAQKSVHAAPKKGPPFLDTPHEQW